MKSKPFSEIQLHLLPVVVGYAYVAGRYLWAIASHDESAIAELFMATFLGLPWSAFGFLLAGSGVWAARLAGWVVLSGMVLNVGAMWYLAGRFAPDRRRTQ